MPPLKPGSAPAFAAALVAVLVLLAAGLGWSWHNVDQAALLAADTLRAQQVLTTLAELQAAVDDDAPAAALAAVGTLQARLRDLLAGNAEQYTRLVALGPLIASRLETPPAGSPAPRGSPPPALGSDGDGRLARRIADALAELRRPAQAEFDALHRRSMEAARSARTAALAPGVFALLLLGAAGWRLLQDRGRQRATSEEIGRARAAQEAADAALRQVMDAVPDAVCVLDAEGRIERVNAGGQALWGRPADGLVGTLWIEQFVPADQRRTEQAVKALQAGEALPQWPGRHLRPDGSTVAAAWCGSWSAQRRTLVCVGRDVGELASLRQRAAHDEQALLTLRDDLAAARGRAEAAGRLNAGFIQTLGDKLSPQIQAIGSAVDNLLQGLAGALTREQQRGLATVREHTQAVHRLAQAGLDLARLETGQLRLQNEAFDVWETANQVAAEMRPLALDKGLKFDVQLAADIGYARGDASRVAQVLRRLLHNAIRCTEQGRVSLHADVPQAGHVRFQVIDTGIGIASPHHAGLFEAFHRIDGKAPAPGGHDGAGLGLAVSRRLARLMGGDLVLEASRPQQGSRFTFTLQADDLQRTDERPAP